MKVRTYSELITLPTLKERFEYLKLNGCVGEETFGYDRYINQMFYRSGDWRRRRSEIVARDFGCDLGVKGYDISGKIIVHHMNPLLLKDFLDKTDYLLNPEFLICVSDEMHKGIHYGAYVSKIHVPVERFPGDTCPWRIGGKNVQI